MDDVPRPARGGTSGFGRRCQELKISEGCPLIVLIAFPFVESIGRETDVAVGIPPTLGMVVAPTTRAHVVRWMLVCWDNPDFTARVHGVRGGLGSLYGCHCESKSPSQYEFGLGLGESVACMGSEKGLTETGR